MLVNSGECMKKIIYIVLVMLTSLPSLAVKDSEVHNYMMANFCQFNGKMKSAYQLYTTMIAQDAPKYMYNGYVHLLNDTQNYQPIIQLIPKLDELFNKDSSIQLIFAQVLERTGKHDLADDRFIKLNDKFKSNQEIAFSTANSYLRRKEPQNALLVIDNLLNSSPPRPNNFIFHFMKSQIYMQLDDKPKALASVKKSLELHPRFDKGLLLFALLQEQAGELEHAIKGYSTFLEVTQGTNKEVEQHLLQLIFKQKIQQKGDSAGNSLVMNQSCFNKALKLFEEKSFTQALEQIDNCLKENPDVIESKLLKIQILSALKQPEKIAQILTSWILKDANNDMWYKTIHLLTQNSISIDQAITILESVHKEQPKNALPVLYLADLTTRSHKTHSALSYLEKALALSTDEQIKAKILYQIGVIHYDTHNHKGLKKVITQAEKLKYSFAPLLNLIAYHYAADDNDNAKAQKLISIVLKQDGTNPHFLDTQALIYYQQKDYQKALPILKKIAQIIPSDYTILIHLAQTHFQCGDIDHALVALNQAIGQARTKEHKKECEQLLHQWKQKKA